MQPYRYLGIGLALALIVAAGGLIALRESRAPSPAAPQSNTATTSSVAVPGVSATLTGNATVKEVNPAPRIKAPDYSLPLSFSSSVSSDVRQAFTAQFNVIQQRLAKNPTDFDAWIDLGIIRKDTGDFAGAAADWAYLTKIYPTSNVAFDDLGDLYANFLHDPAKAKANYEMALKLSPGDQVAKQGLAGLNTSQ